MRVLQIIDKLDVGGAERVLVNMTNILFEKNVDVSVLCLLEESDLDGELHKDVQIYYLRRKNKFSLLKIIELYKILSQFDIVHLHSRHILRYVGLLLYLPKSFRSFKIIYQDHSLLDLKTNLKEKHYLHSLINKVDATIIVAEEQKNFFPEGIPTFLLENTVRKFDSRNVLNVDSKKLVAIGNFRRIKNYYLLLEILQKLPEEYTCDIYVGNIDQEYYDENRKIVNKLIDEKRLTVIQGKLNIQSYLGKYSLAVHTSLSESGPLVAVECLSVGLPILMYNTGAVAKHIKKIIPELVRDEKNCKEWVCSILDYHSDIEKMKEYSTALYALYLETYSEDKYYQKCLEIYQNTMSS